MAKVKNWIFLAMSFTIASIFYWILVPNHGRSVKPHWILFSNGKIHAADIPKVMPFSKGCPNHIEAHKRRESFKPFTFYPVGSSDLYVFSAFADTRFKNHIRLIGMGIHRRYSGLKCILTSESEITETDAKIEYLPEGHGLKYDAVFIHCVSNQPLKSGSYVGLTDRNCSVLNFLLPIRIIPTPPSEPSKSIGISLCAPPIHSNFNNVDQVIEFIELNRILGFRHFVFYNASIGADVMHVLQYYSKRKIVSIIPWDMPVPSGSAYPYPKHYQIHYFGQIVAIHDCLFRMMNQPYRYIAFQDLDEFLVPKKNDTNLLSLLNSITDPTVAAVSFPNGKFNTDGVNTKNRMISMTITRRDAAVLHHGDRSKMVVDSNRVLIMGIHFVWKFTRGKAKNLRADEGLLHHYKNWGKIRHLVDDKRLLVYAEELKRNVDEVLKNINA